MTHPMIVYWLEEVKSTSDFLLFLSDSEQIILRQSDV